MNTNISFTDYTNIINTCQRNLLDTVGETFHYENWSDRDCREQTREKIGKLQQYIHKFFKRLDPFSENELLPLPTRFEQVLANPDSLSQLGFGRFDATLWLIPLWMKPFIDPTAVVESIDGDKMPLSNADDDTRGGLLAFGFRLFQL